MKPDITCRADIETFVNAFYDRVRADALLAPAFAYVNWPLHLPVMYDFWESVLLNSAVYRGNPIAAHIRADQQYPLSEAMFERWLYLFHETLDNLFSGLVTTDAKTRASVMKVLIWTKVQQSREPGFIQ